MPRLTASRIRDSLRDFLRDEPSHDEELARDLLDVLGEQYRYLTNAELIAEILTGGDGARYGDASRHLRDARETIGKFQDNLVVRNIRRGLGGLSIARRINRLIDAYEALPNTHEMRRDPQAAGAAFDDFFIAVGELESLLPPGLSHYAKLVGDIGKSGFFKNNVLLPRARGAALHRQGLCAPQNAGNTLGPMCD